MAQTQTITIAGVNGNFAHANGPFMALAEIMTAAFPGKEVHKYNININFVILFCRARLCC